MGQKEGYMSQEREEVVKVGMEPLNPNEVKADEELTQLREGMIGGAIPSGYVPVQLSTRGKIYAPAKFHIRNFNTEDLMELSLVDQENLPIKAIEMLNNIILEYDPAREGAPGTVNVKTFHEREVHELLLFVYRAFYTDTLSNLTWTLTEEDWEFKKQEFGGEDSDEYRSLERAVKNGSFKPTFSIHIPTGVHYHEIEDGFKTSVRVEKPKFGFVCQFGLPRYGDVIDLKYFIEGKYKELDKRWANVASTLKMRKEAEDRLMKGENVNLRGIPDIPKAEREKFHEYEVEKSVFAMTAIKAWHLQEINQVPGQDQKKVFDVRGLPLEKRMELVRNPHIDHSTFEQVQEVFNKLQFGIKEEITVVDPILNKTVQRKYSFQLLDLLAAIRNQRPAETVLTVV